MATTVNEAFNEFMKNSVNLDSNRTSVARSSHDNFIDNINGFSGDDDFFAVYKERNLKYGLFSRGTKIKTLDDIDLMLCLSSEGERTYTDSFSCVYINASQSDIENGIVSSNTTHLNSTKVINRFISKLAAMNDYKKAEMHKNMEAATLQLKSYEWTFDSVPCFYTNMGVYLSP